MKKLYFLFFLTIGFFANAQIINFIDTDFKAKLLSASPTNPVASIETPIGTSYNVYSYNKIDTNNNGEIELSEAEAIQWLSIGSSSINNLSGIENFVNLKVFWCNDNLLTNFNAPTLSNLRYLNFSNNNLSNLDLTNLVSLESLHCFNNQLLNLNITGLSNLRYLDCSNNLLVNIDIPTPSSYFDEINCSNNQLINLDVSGVYVGYLSCNSNQLTRLFINHNNNNDYYIQEIHFYDNPNLQYICADEIDLDWIQSKINNYGYSSTCHVNSYCSFTPGATFYEISGNTKFDFNNNSCDVSDINYSNLNFSITDGTNSGSMISNLTGNYYIPVSAGNHTITPNLENPSYFTISPTNFTVDFPTQASPFMQDFCVTANGIKHDVEVVLIPSVPARPGFDATYKLVYRNKGNQIENGSISLTFDDLRLDYVSSNPVYDNSVTNNFTWNYTNLQPFETREIEIVYNLNSPMETPAVNNGDILNFTATITIANTDETPTDNSFTLDQTVVGSYDPNDKMCLQGTTITPTEVGKYVHYVIRFENTGTFPAENIVVKDMIDLAKFDITTLVPLKSSHDFFTRINGNKVEFIFENINLDFNDATNDGYVLFKIKTKPILVLGDTFTNNANIYFDYNFPITTNTYTTTVAALSTQDFDFGSYFTLYPNPAEEVLNIQTKQGLAINSIEIYNQLGQIVIATTNTINSIDVSSLASGTYFVKINSEKGSANAKFVKE